jgi:hypothetical protein
MLTGAHRIRFMTQTGARAIAKLLPDERRFRPGATRTACLAAAILVLASPQILATMGASTPSYPFITIVFTLLLVGVVALWPGTDVDLRPAVVTLGWTPALVSIAAAGLIVAAMFWWTRMVLWEGHQADMLIVIREATRGVLSGRNPYTTYRTYDAPWDMVLPYGPVLWGPFLVPQLLRIDFRLLTVIGQLFVPAWCGIAAVTEAARRRPASTAAWFGVALSLLLAFEVAHFVLIGHTPIYWPLLPLFAATVMKKRWVAAACMLGVLVVARSTMAAIVPILLMVVWHDDRRRLPIVTAALVLTPATLLAPFIVWDYRALWDGMVLSYSRVIKGAVWSLPGRQPFDLVGATGWLLEHQLHSIVEYVQVVVMIAAYVLAWPAIGRGAHPIGVMALALHAFCMTTLAPIYYIYYDVLLLLASGALVEAVEGTRSRMSPGRCGMSLAALIVLVAATMRVLASPFPEIAAGEPSPGVLLRSGFDRPERDGVRRFAWVVGTDARIVIPRGSSADAEIVLTVRSPFNAEHPPQMLTAVLNGKLLAQTAVSAGWQEIRFAAPASAWWIGHNELRLKLAGALRPSDVGAGNVRRRLSLALSRVDVRPPGK